MNQYTRLKEYEIPYKECRCLKGFGMDSSDYETYENIGKLYDEVSVECKKHDKAIVVSNLSVCTVLQDDLRFEFLPLDEQKPYDKSGKYFYRVGHIEGYELWVDCQMTWTETDIFILY